MQSTIHTHVDSVDKHSHLTLIVPDTQTVGRASILQVRVPHLGPIAPNVLLGSFWACPAMTRRLTVSRVCLAHTRLRWELSRTQCAQTAQQEPSLQMRAIQMWGHVGRAVLVRTQCLVLKSAQSVWLANTCLIQDHQGHVQIAQPASIQQHLQTLRVSPVVQAYTRRRPVQYLLCLARIVLLEHIQSSKLLHRKISVQIAQPASIQSLQQIPAWMIATLAVKARTRLCRDPPSVFCAVWASTRQRLAPMPQAFACFVELVNTQIPLGLLLTVPFVDPASTRTP